MFQLSNTIYFSLSLNIFVGFVAGISTLRKQGMVQGQNP